MQVLITSLPASGHVHPLIAVAQALQKAGHSVTFASGQQYQAQLEEIGLRAVPLHYPPEGYAQALAAFSKPLPRFPHIIWDRPQRGFFTFLPELTEQVIHILQNDPFDVMLTDFNFYAGPIVAEACGIPYATFCAIVNALPSRDTPTFGAKMGWRPAGHPLRLVWHLTRWGSRWYLGWDDRAVNQVRRQYGLPKVDFPIWYPSPYLFVAPTTEAYEYPRRDLPPQAVYVGPVISTQRGDIEEDFEWDWLEKDDRPTLYVSLGTVVRYLRIFKMVIELAAGANWKAVLAVGKGVDLGQFGTVPENILLKNYVPQHRLLPKVAAVISHGGNNTVTETLLHGKPLIVIPITGDQPESAGRVVKCGAGLRLDVYRLRRQQLGRAIERILTEAAFKTAAEQVQADYQKCHGAETIVRLLERLNEARAPLHRPQGMRPTLYAPQDAENLSVWA